LLRDGNESQAGQQKPWLGQQRYIKKSVKVTARQAKHASKIPTAHLAQALSLCPFARWETSRELLVGLIALAAKNAYVCEKVRNSERSSGEIAERFFSDKT
jgi:hypothetical protein